MEGDQEDKVRQNAAQESSNREGNFPRLGRCILGRCKAHLCLVYPRECPPRHLLRTCRGTRAPKGIISMP